MVEEEFCEEGQVLAEELVLEAVDFPYLVGVVAVDFCSWRFRLQFAGILYTGSSQHLGIGSIVVGIVDIGGLRAEELTTCALIPPSPVIGSPAQLPQYLKHQRQTYSVLSSFLLALPLPVPPPTCPFIPPLCPSACLGTNSSGYKL